ncbi:type IV pilus assembly protein PilN [Thermolongibacillus altinsuensis]|uniref:Type IV pilus assembly protein PilN n=1 Tax=Thermolongibacillus altinsuensis TaxID=575256 RepID=A0A4R1QG55_9BACL|nr:PilN domain-containing protein [Thermolongibacillus altinsuensis]TCL51932.1 type IV pilus assembly protein PilN [Thermolongibacillus altinsuensis]
MLVEINLLPKKEPKSRLFLILVTVLALFCLVSGAIFYVFMGKMENRIEQLKARLDETKALRIAEEQKMSSDQWFGSAQQLEEAVKWAEQYPLETVRILRELIKLLPERGFIMNFSYQEKETIQLTVQFDTNREAAAYVKALSEAPFVTDVKLTSLTIAQQQESDAEQQESKIEEETMPRYIGQFQLKLNEEELRKSEKEGDS